MKLKLAFFLLPQKEGKPKYFSFFFISRTAKACLMWSLVSSEVDFLKKKGSLFLFIY